jgi:hypothetical protein
MPSILIPAHDEERVLGENLAALLDGLDPGVEVIVACNGCSDGTAQVAGRFVPRVRVLELETASKVRALNAAEGTAPSFPRLYLDADIRFGGTEVNRLLEFLAAQDAPAAEPRVRFDLSRSGFLVRSWYAVWTGLHGGSPGDVGGGLYALTAEGRARFGAFPDVISDDGFVRAHFAAGEILRCDEAQTLVRAPHSVADLVRIKTRGRLGTRQLARQFPDLWSGKRGGERGLLAKVLGLRPVLWPLFPIYATIQVLIRLRADRQEREPGGVQWERDRSTR